MTAHNDWYAASRARSARYWQERLGREPTFEERADALVELLGQFTSEVTAWVAETFPPAGRGRRARRRPLATQAQGPKAGGGADE